MYVQLGVIVIYLVDTSMGEATQKLKDCVCEGRWRKEGHRDKSMVKIKCAAKSNGRRSSVNQGVSDHACIGLK